MSFEWGSGSNWRSGGSLAVDKSQAGYPPGVLKRQILEILQSDKDTVPRALKRLRPTPVPRGKKRKTAESSRAEDGRGQGLDVAFNQLTEAASELMDMGYEDIYQHTREQIAASISSEDGPRQGSQYVWHDDGTVANDKAAKHAMYQRDRDADITTYQAPQAKQQNGSNSSQDAQKPALQTDTVGNVGASLHQAEPKHAAAADASSSAADEPSSKAAAAAPSSGRLLSPGAGSAKHLRPGPSLSSVSDFSRSLLEPREHMAGESAALVDSTSPRRRFCSGIGGSYASA
ncbi:hypothetical protein WJX73_008691 [Symbiochloris irregularis]|uniref:Uncharacterized protein n=1 Tax=Symbiochloris irregularis TaxID=706552 RepID=A0AAW1NPX6_9CHLO